jgi:hypothetical protein
MADRLSNGRPLLPGATPLGVATRGEIGLFGEKWYDNNGDKVDDPAGSPMEKYAGKESRDKKDKKVR